MSNFSIQYNRAKTFLRWNIQFNNQAHKHDFFNSQILPFDFKMLFINVFFPFLKQERSTITMNVWIFINVPAFLS